MTAHEQVARALAAPVRSPAARRGEILATLLLLGGLAAAPLAASRATVNDLGQALCLGLFAISFNIIFKYSGLLSFGHAAFYGFGAYAEALMLQNFPNVPLIALLPAAALAAGLLGLILGHICVRREGAYFSMTTLAIGAGFATVALKWSGVTGGTDGIDGLMPGTLNLLPFWSLQNPGISQLYWLELGFLLPCGLAAWAVLELTPFGQTVRAIRQNETRARFLGHDTHAIKLAVFTLAAALAGLAGALWAIDNGFVSTDSIDLSFSTTVIIAALIGGSQWYWGPVIGAIVYIGASDWLSAVTPHWQIWLGLGFIAMVLAAPGGISGIGASAWRKAVARDG